MTVIIPSVEKKLILPHFLVDFPKYKTNHQVSETSKFHPIKNFENCKIVHVRVLLHNALLSCTVLINQHLDYW